MSVKGQGSEFNRTLTTFLDVGDIGSFGRGNVSFVIKGDANRKLYITGFSLAWQTGIAADAGVTGFSEVSLIENFQANPDSNIPIIPNTNSSLRFYYAENGSFTCNNLDRQFESPFPLSQSTTYSLVGSVIPGVTPITATITVRLTVFGFEQLEGEAMHSFYARAR